MSKLDEAKEAILDRIISATKEPSQKEIGPEVRNLAGAYQGLAAS